MEYKIALVILFIVLVLGVTALGVAYTRGMSELKDEQKQEAVSPPTGLLQAPAAQVSVEDQLTALKRKQTMTWL